jgi:hypothetical protein
MTINVIRLSFIYRDQCCYSDSSLAQALDKAFSNLSRQPIMETETDGTSPRHHWRCHALCLVRTDARGW